MRVTPLVSSTFTSDGGTMFGLVPKPIWARKVRADEHNRIPQHAHNLFVELEDGRRGFIDTGCGSAERFPEKEQRLHGLGPGWPLADWMTGRGVRPEDVDFVVFTHLHWDHGGGAVAPPSMGRALTFPRARHVVHALEWEDALSGNPLLYKSYPADMIAALGGADWDLVREDDREILPGVRLVRTSGHTRGHASILLEHPRLELAHPDAPAFADIRHMLLAGDVCPSQHNLRMVFQTSYDTFPLDTRAWKQAWLPRIARERMLLLFDHDPAAYGATIRPDPREEFAVERVLACEGGP